MPRKRSTHLKPVNVQGFTVAIYRLGDGRTAFVDKSGGQRKMRAFTDESRARAEAQKYAAAVLRGEAVRHEFTASDIAVYRRVLEMLGSEVPIVSVVHEWTTARKLIGDRPLLDVVRSGMENISRPSKTFNEVVEGFLAAKRMAGVSSIYLDELTEDLTVFGRTFGEFAIASITTDDVQTWLAERPVGIRRRNNLRATLVTLFRFAQDRGLLADGKVAPQKIQKGKERRGAVSVYTAEEMRFWIQHVKTEMFPWIVIGGFSGVRTEEICPGPDSRKDRLRWSDFNWKKGHITVRAEVAKTNERRIVPIMENLADWLQPYHNATGPVVPDGSRTDRESERLSKLSKRLAKKAEENPLKFHHPCPGLTWRQNALRHSYGSYRLSWIKNAPQVAYEMGNSVAMIKRHYHEAQEEDVAKQYFEIRPLGAGEKIVQMNFGIS